MQVPTEMEKQGRCSLCGKGLLKPCRIDKTFEYGDEDTNLITVSARDVPVEVCEACGEIYSGPDAARVEHEAICRALGLLPPSEIRRIREQFGPSQEEFAELTGIGVATISRWERGRMLQNKAMDRYLRLLDHYPDNRRRLESLNGPVETELPPGRRIMAPDSA
ncbi:MAG: type II toxin-antitoxin system MqsA family antitoxin [Gemmataceae bacterium]|nr:type II toxin-antitoxin system MqsA family antitoxin [Gemmataceae bacterium]